MIKQLYVVLPTFNEGDALCALVLALNEVLQAYAFHIFVVDDGSTDGSTEKVADLNLPPVTIVRHDCNQGLGSAIRTGFNMVLSMSEHDNDVLVMMDADLTHTPNLIPRMISLIAEGNDLVIASRFRYGAQIRGLSWQRQFFSHAASWVFRCFLPIPGVKDYTCGFRAYRVGLLRQAANHYQESFISESGFSCMVDVLLKLGRLKAIMVEVPMILRYDWKVSASKMNVLQTILASLRLLVKTVFRQMSNRPQSIE